MTELNQGNISCKHGLNKDGNGRDLTEVEDIKKSWQEYWNGLLFPTPWNLPDPGIKPASPASPPWCHLGSPLFSSVQSLSHVQLFATACIAACQASLSITNFRSSLRFTFIESVMPSSLLILGRPLLLLPPIPPSIEVFSNEPTLHMRWPKY